MTTTDLRASRPYLLLATGAAVVLLVLGGLNASRNGTVSTGVGFYAFEALAVWPALLAALATAAAPVVALRWTWPAYALAAVPTGVLAVVQQAWLFSSFLGLLALALVVLGRSTWAGWLIGLSALALPATLAVQWTLAMPDGALIYMFPEYSAGRIGTTLGLYVVAVVAVLVVGHLFRGWAGRAEERRAVEAERRAVVVDGAALGERARLARDLHDVVAHHVSLIAVRAETAPYTVPDLGEGGRAAMADIADDARRAMEELRGVLGVLRRADGSVALAPQPTGADVAALVADAARAGEVAYDGDEHVAALPAPSGYAAYRMVQEALTNARRHAPGAAVAVTAARVDGRVTLRVANPVAPGTVLEPGAGLAGMRERVEAVGGEFRGGVLDGAVVVEAELPVEVTA